jgi:ATP-dependent DNA helicase RecG
LDTARLRQIFELERKHEFNNTAVIGGLDRFLAIWTSTNMASIGRPAMLRRLRQLWPPDFRYSGLAPGQRTAWIASILEVLDELEKPVDKTALAPADAPAPKTRLKRTPPVSVPAAGSQVLESSVTVIKGISTALAAKFARLGVQKVRDLLYYFPFRHLDYAHVKSISQLEEGNEQTVMVSVWETRIIMPGGRRSSEAILGDDTGNVRAVWFNNPWISRQLTTGSRVVLSGRVKYFNGRPVFESPDWEIIDEQELLHTGRLVPVYGLTSGLYQRQVRKIIKSVLDDYLFQLPEFLPNDIIRRYAFPGLTEAVSQSHFPSDNNQKDTARTRLAFDELFLLQLGVLSRKRNWQCGQPGIPLKPDPTFATRFTASLPFTLTGAQARVIGEIQRDLARDIPMSRLLQGEVGSGKTVVALSALLTAVLNGYQGALMAPTEILAEQHLSSIRRMLTEMGGQETEEGLVFSYSGILKQPVSVALLTGDVKATGKAELKKQLAAGEIDIVIGTHALIQKGVNFKRLALAVIDEQHRFGVEQRSKLRQKGFNPHILVMTATPIPRTLALTLFGDLDLSVIDELPPGRQIIRTKWMKPEQRAAAYKFLRKEIGEGHQAFVICPLVEESESIQAKAAVAEFQRLSSDVFPDLRLGLLHGRLASSEKDRIMTAFKNHEMDMLVSTSVVEVGIDVPNATVMMVEGADRFGLSQLHQFRGRVGRGSAPSYCMLMADSITDIGRQRLDIIEHNHDGFKLADEDLKLRGPGEFFGTRQSGIPDLRMARLSDAHILEQAREAALSLFERDPELVCPEHSGLVREMNRVWNNESGERS